MFGMCWDGFGRVWGIFFGGGWEGSGGGERGRKITFWKMSGNAFPGLGRPGIAFLAQKKGKHSDYHFLVPGAGGRGRSP